MVLVSTCLTLAMLLPMDEHRVLWGWIMVPLLPFPLWAGVEENSAVGTAPKYPAQQIGKC